MGQYFWAREYFVSTAARDGAVIREYIRNQEKEDQCLDQLNMWSCASTSGGAKIRGCVSNTIMPH